MPADRSTARCPWCGTRPARVSCVTDPAALPEPGDVTVCSACRQVAVFTDTGKARPTPEQDVEIRANADVAWALAHLNRTQGPVLLGGASRG